MIKNQLLYPLLKWEKTFGQRTALDVKQKTK